MADLKNTPGNKNKNELILTIFFLFLISAVSAAIVIYFRIKMKPYQLPIEKIENVEDATYPDKQSPAIINK